MSTLPSAFCVTFVNGNSRNFKGLPSSCDESRNSEAEIHTASNTSQENYIQQITIQPFHARETNACPFSVGLFQLAQVPTMSEILQAAQNVLYLQAHETDFRISQRLTVKPTSTWAMTRYNQICSLLQLVYLFAYSSAVKTEAVFSSEK
jgi:hypothetical protein